jgi:hypothetical protein
MLIPLYDDPGSMLAGMMSGHRAVISGEEAAVNGEGLTGDERGRV